MVAKAWGYYRLDFQGFRGVTNGDTLSPTNFNVVVDAMVRNWVEVMVEGADKQSRSGKKGRHQNALFYADNGIIASSDPRWL